MTPSPDVDHHTQDTFAPHARLPVGETRTSFGKVRHRPPQIQQNGH